VRRADHILADSNSTKRDLQSIWNVLPERITVLYSGVNEHFRPVADRAKLAAIRARYGLGDAPFVLTVGTVQPRKNYELLVRAFKPVADGHPHALVIAGGKGWLGEGLAAEIERQGLRDRVRLVGFVDDDDLPGLYSAADLFVFPSLYEGFGLPLLEAMACGAPVISSNASSLPEVVQEQDATVQANTQPGAVLLSPHDEIAWSAAMLRLLEDGEARRKLVEAGFARSARFSWRAAARQLAELYRRLLPPDNS
jgi:glycosyltransferase involved in cell wall biosynthesis